MLSRQFFSAPINCIAVFTASYAIMVSPALGQVSDRDKSLFLRENFSSIQCDVTGGFIDSNDRIVPATDPGLGNFRYDGLKIEVERGRIALIELSSQDFVPTLHKETEARIVQEGNSTSMSGGSRFTISGPSQILMHHYANPKELEERESSPFSLFMGTRADGGNGYYIVRIAIIEPSSSLSPEQIPQLSTLGFLWPFQKNIIDDFCGPLNPSINQIGGDQIYFQNQCDQPINLSLRYRQPSNTWRTLGWWNLDPNESSFLASEDQRIRASSSIFNFYAEITQEPNTNYRWSGEISQPFDGRMLPMREVISSRDSDGNHVLSVQCDSL